MSDNIVKYTFYP